MVRSLCTLVLGVMLMVGLLALPAAASGTEAEADDEYSYVELGGASDVGVQTPGTAYDVEMPPDPQGLLAAAGYYDIINRWNDLRGRPLVLRQGRWDHLRSKHGLTISTVQKVTQREDRVLERGTTYRYTTIARLYTCRTLPFPECTITAEQLIRVIYETRRLGDGEHAGVITAYCLGIDGLCPAWVNSSL